MSTACHVYVERHCNGGPHQPVVQREMRHRAAASNLGYTADPKHMWACTNCISVDPATPPALGGEDGSPTAQVVAQVTASRPDSEQGFRSRWACASVPSARKPPAGGRWSSGPSLSRRRIAPQTGVGVKSYRLHLPFFRCAARRGARPRRRPLTQKVARC